MSFGSTCKMQNQNCKGSTPQLELTICCNLLIAIDFKNFIEPNCDLE